MSSAILGQENAFSILSGHLRRGETRHAYLFTGPANSGRRTTALRLAMILNCVNPPAPDECCGVCRMCRLIEKMEHPDLTVVSTETPGDILKIDAIRDLQRTLTLTPYEAQYRIALILRFEEANAAAQNALLKTLEEPPDRVKIFLTASSENAVLPTVLSRCEPIRIRSMKVDVLAERLRAEGFSDENDAIDRAAHLAGGRVGFTRTLLNEPELLEKYEQSAADFLELMPLRIREKFAFAATFRETRRRNELRDLFRIWETTLRDLLLIAAGVDDQKVPLSLVRLRETLCSTAEGKDPAQFRRTLVSLDEALRNLNANVSPQLVLENFLLNV